MAHSLRVSHKMECVHSLQCHYVVETKAGLRERDVLCIRYNYQTKKGRKNYKRATYVPTWDDREADLSV